MRGLLFERGLLLAVLGRLLLGQDGIGDRRGQDDDVGVLGRGLCRGLCWKRRRVGTADLGNLDTREKSEGERVGIFLYQIE